MLTWRLSSKLGRKKMVSTPYFEFTEIYQRKITVHLQVPLEMLYELSTISDCPEYQSMALRTNQLSHMTVLLAKTCYLTNPYDPDDILFMFQCAAGGRVDLLSWVGLSFFYVFIQFYVHLLTAHIWRGKLLK